MVGLCYTVGIMAKKKPAERMITNRRARFDYELGDTLVVGLELTGGETKALRMNHGQLSGAYVNVRGGELWLVNARVSPSSGIPIDETGQTRDRRLLAKRREIDTLVEAKQQGRTIVPLELLTRGRYIKLRIAVGKGKKNYDKRQTLKARDESRAIQRALRP
ncbi:MAG: SsrA-binding protein [Candidatus Saccharibacteria bacterium]|nr:SsrA-binding protein [Candidatus Saccharibacteria bacterium]